MVRPLETVQDQEWHNWKQFKAEQYKREQELKEFQAWKAAQKQTVVKQLSANPKGHELFRSIWHPLQKQQQRFAF
jgi:hypothetical protein